MTMVKISIYSRKLCRHVSESMCRCLCDSQRDLRPSESWETWIKFVFVHTINNTKHFYLCTASRRAEWGLFDGKTKPNCVRREGYFNVILSSPTLDKGLAALKLAVTFKHSLWCSSYSLMGTWLMADALKAHSSPSPNAEMKPRLYTNSNQRHTVLHCFHFYIWAGNILMKLLSTVIIFKWFAVFIA